MSWQLGMWLLCFKNWQTAFEMDFIFRFVDEARMRAHNKIYMAMHAVILTIVVSSTVISTVATIKFWVQISIIGSILSYLGVTLILCLFVDSMRRMQIIIRRIPILKKSEKFFYTLISMYILFFVAFTNAIWIALYYKPRFTSIADLYFTPLYIFELVLVGLMNSINLLTCWIALRYNQPLMTRTDLKTGKNVSLLLFVRSRYDMRRIFDPDEDE